MSDEEKTALLADVKNYLDITWEDPAADRKLGGLIASGIRYLNDKLGPGVDYTQEGGDGQTLLMEYVRYFRDGALDIFETNYQALILAAQNRRKVKAYAEAADAEEP